jgi:Zn finger protein HypA/HybF involved in hydrogenase expression
VKSDLGINEELMKYINEVKLFRNDYLIRESALKWKIEKKQQILDSLKLKMKSFEDNSYFESKLKLIKSKIWCKSCHLEAVIQFSNNNGNNYCSEKCRKRDLNISHSTHSSQLINGF